MTDAGEIIVTGTAVGHDDTINALIDASLQHVHRSRREPGCISHEVFRDVENPNRLFFYERWSSRSALDAHFAVPASHGFVTTLQSLTSETPTIRIDPVVAQRSPHPDR